MKRTTLGRVFALLAALAPVGSASGAPRPRVWMMPPPFPGNGAPLRELIAAPDAWVRTRAAVDGFGYWPSLLNVHFTDEQIRSLFTIIRRAKLPFAFEAPVLKKETPSARQSFELLQQQMRRFAPLGARIDSLSYDEPLYAARHLLGMSVETATNETAAFIAFQRAAYPRAQSVLVEPYPALTLAQLKEGVARIQTACSARHVAGLDMVRLDVDWHGMANGLGGSWTEVRDLERFCRSRRIRFSLICWSANYPSLKEKGQDGPTTWYDGMMHTLDAYRAVGGAPDEWMVESWLHIPARSLPETDPETFTRAVLDLSRRVGRSR